MAYGVHRLGLRWQVYDHQGVESESMAGGRWRGSGYVEMEREVLQMERKSLVLPVQEHVGMSCVVVLCCQGLQRLT